MIYHHIVFGFLLSVFAVGIATTVEAQEATRPRIVVLTDITNEPDDQESLVRFLVYSNEYEVEGLIATTSTWLRNRTSVKNIKECVVGYGKVRDNLARHAVGFPTQQELESVIREGRPEFGMQGVGEGKDTAGSEHIIKVVDRDDARPVWVTAWGGSNCLAQALWKVRKTRSAEELELFVSKIRVYTISDQDDAGPWMRQQFPDLYYVVSPGGERDKEYNQATWTGISGDAYYLNGPGYWRDLVSNDWLAKNVRENHGALGKNYLPWEYIMEGDTPSFMNLINNGLGSHENPSYGGWGGRYFLKKTYADAGPIWQNTRDHVVTPDGKEHVSNTATIWRWRQAFQHDFAARMDWCVSTYKEANHNPTLVVAGDKTKNIIHMDVKLNQKVSLSAEGSVDDDGDDINYKWFHYGEAERDLPNVRDIFRIPLAGAETSEVSFRVPEKMPRGTQNIHIILDAEDNGTPSLHAYRRVVLHVK